MLLQIGTEGESGADQAEQPRASEEDPLCLAVPNRCRLQRVTCAMIATLCATGDATDNTCVSPKETRPQSTQAFVSGASVSGATK